MAVLSPDRTCESQTGVAPASRVCESNERTNERTYVDANTDCDIPEVSATCAGVQAEDVDIPSLADVLAVGIAGTGQRFERVRTGEREPIPYHVRAAVWLRDRGVCQKCFARDPKPWELDHILPWSAGGSDRTENLRVLCEPCNQKRSNFDDGTTFAKRPITWWCHRCYVDPVQWIYESWVPQGAYCPTHRHDSNGRAKGCAVERVYRWQRESGEAPTWHKRLPIETLSINAYCAHCGLPGLTDVTL